MVGPWQVPVADAAVTTLGFKTLHGEAMSMGERSPLALIDPAASARMAVGEALTNLACVVVEDLGRVVLSANWMAAAGRGNEDQALFDAVAAVGLELCPALGIAIPVGKDSLSMHTQWRGADGERAVTAPVTLIVSAFAPVPDVRHAVTPMLRLDRGATRLLLRRSRRRREPARWQRARADATPTRATSCPDVDDAGRLAAFFRAVQDLIRDGRVLAYHDRSDGGLVVCALEMAFAGRCGLAIDIAALGERRRGRCARGALQRGARRGTSGRGRRYCDVVRRRFEAAGLSAFVHDIGTPQPDRRIVIRYRLASCCWKPTPRHCRRRWAETSHRMQRLRDDPDCADEEFALIAADDPGMRPSLTFAPDDDVAAPFINLGARPRVAVLREQGVNSHLEMAAVFERAGFDPIDVHMSDLLEHRRTLDEFRVLVACGGFSYGDVLGGGGGWAKSILYHPEIRDAFSAFFAADTLSLGVCNGCQMFAQLKSLIPGAARLAAIRSQSFGAVRGAYESRSDQLRRVTVARRNGGFGAADRGRPRRRPRRIRIGQRVSRR